MGVEHVGSSTQYMTPSSCRRVPRRLDGEDRLVVPEVAPALGEQDGALPPRALLASPPITGMSCCWR